MLPTLSRRDYLIRFLQTTVGAWGMGAGLAHAQDMSVLGRVQDLSDARLRTFDEMVAPYVVRQPMKHEGVTLSMPMLADNGHLVPLGLKVDPHLFDLATQPCALDGHVCAGTMEWPR
jgi:hypothetical protein